MNSFLQKTGLLILMLVSVFWVNACSQSQNTLPDGNAGYVRDVFRVSYSTTFGSVIQHVMNEKNILDKYLPEGVSSEWININGGQDMRDALVADKIDVAVPSSSIVTMAIENGFPLIILANGPFMPGKVFSGSPDIKSMDDITPSSKISVINMGSVVKNAVEIYAKEMYSDPFKFENNFVAMDNADALALMKNSNELDCAVFYFPFSVRAEKTEKLTPILDITPIMLENSLGTFVTTSLEFYTENPVLIEAFYKAMNETVKFINGHPDEVGELLAEYYGTDADDISSTVEEFPVVSEVSEKGYDKIADFMHEIGLLSETPHRFSELPNYDDIPKTE
jgi:ABC-type nitrate/sulfonate/bicarbonate transport system substrate-binding protein